MYILHNSIKFDLYENLVHINSSSYTDCDFEYHVGFALSFDSIIPLPFPLPFRRSTGKRSL